MKKLLLSIALVGSFVASQAQTKTIAVETAGTLETLISSEEMSSVQSLTVTGQVNKEDLTIINAMTALTSLDLSGVNIIASTDSIFIEDESGKDTIIDVFDANTIPDEVFSGNKTIAKIVFPNSLEGVGENAFYICDAITALDFSNCPNLRIIEEYAFGSIQETLTSVSFNGCSKLESIGAYAFTNDKALANIDFSGCSSLTVIGNRAFLNNSIAALDLSECTALTEVADNSFRGLKVATSLVLPPNASYIGENAFYQCNALTEITIPAAVDTIGFKAFYQPKALQTVICEGETTFAIERAFTSVTLDKNPAEESYTYSLVVPQGCADTYRACPEWAKFVISESAGIENTEEESGIIVRSTGNNLVIEGAPAQAEIKVFAVNGSLLCQTTVSDSTVVILPVAQKGMLIVQVETQAFSVLHQ